MIVRPAIAHITKVDEPTYEDRWAHGRSAGVVQPM